MLFGLWVTVTRVYLCFLEFISFYFGMPGILSHVLSFSVDPGVGLEGTTSPYLVYGFESGHITTFIQS